MNEEEGGPPPQWVATCDANSGAYFGGQSRSLGTHNVYWSQWSSQGAYIAYR